MIAHLGYNVSDFTKAKEMYKRALAPLGISLKMEGEGHAGFGSGENLELWIGATSDKHPIIATDVHVCFMAKNREEVDMFYSEGLAAGFKDNGASGIREHYAPNYYAAFLLDLDGNNIEAVCFN